MEIIFEEENITVFQHTDGVRVGICEVHNPNLLFSTSLKNLVDSKGVLTIDSIRDAMIVEELKKEERNYEWSRYGEEGNY